MKDLPNIDDLWDYNNPAETEKAFRSVLLCKSEARLEYFLELETQLARTQSLQRNFVLAHEILDKVKDRMKTEMFVVRIRYFLERGRTYNSNNQKEEAVKQFKEAFKLSTKYGQEYFAIDAAHMLGIAFVYPENLEWNEKAVKIAETSEDEKSQKWLGSLYNNMGWMYHSKDEYSSALIYFEKALKYQEEGQAIEKILIAKWCVGRCLRSLGKIDEALAIQKSLNLERETESLEQSGYVFEELGELLLLMDRKEASKMYFSKAHQILSSNIWLQTNEKPRLDRLRNLSL